MPHPTPMTCPYCQATYQPTRAPRAGQRYDCGQPACTRARKAEVQRAWQAKYRAEHGHSSTRAYDADPVYKAKAKERARLRNEAIPVRTRYPAQMAAKDARRRIKMAEATIEVFDPIEIFERDEWICGICEEPVDTALVFPHPMSKSLDHIQPIALGGDHSRANTQLAHLGCNIRKGARVEG